MIYHYALGRRAEHAAAVFDSLNVALQVDGYRAYKTERGARGDNRRLVLAHCWAHGRRKLREIFDCDASSTRARPMRAVLTL